MQPSSEDEFKNLSKKFSIRGAGVTRALARFLQREVETEVRGQRRRRGNAALMTRGLRQISKKDGETQLDGGGEKTYMAVCQKG